MKAKNHEEAVTKTWIDYTVESSFVYEGSKYFTMYKPVTPTPVITKLVRCTQNKFDPDDYIVVELKPEFTF
jgi:hypothetical protein